MIGFSSITRKLIVTTAQQLLRRIEKKDDDISLRTAVFETTIKNGKTIQLQLIATNIDFLDAFVTEEMKE